MSESHDHTKTRVGRALLLSLIGIAVVSPIPIFAAYPSLIPAWMLSRVAGATALSWLLVLIMLALVGVAVACVRGLASEQN